MENTNQPSRVAFDSVTLDGTYANNEKVIDVKAFDRLVLDIDYTRGSGEGASIMKFKLEHSPDGVNWYNLTIDSTGETSVITPRVWEVQDTNKVSVIINIAYKQIKMSAIETGVVTNAGTLSTDYTLSRL